MSELSSLEDLRRIFKEVAEAKVGGFDDGKLSVDYNCNLKEAFDKYAGLLCGSIKNLTQKR